MIEAINKKEYKTIGNIRKKINQMMEDGKINQNHKEEINEILINTMYLLHISEVLKKDVITKENIENEIKKIHSSNTNIVNRINWAKYNIDISSDIRIQLSNELYKALISNLGTVFILLAIYKEKPHFKQGIEYHTKEYNEKDTIFNIHYKKLFQINFLLSYEYYCSYFFPGATVNQYTSLNENIQYNKLKNLIQSPIKQSATIKLLGNLKGLTLSIGYLYDKGKQYIAIDRNKHIKNDFIFQKYNNLISKMFIPTKQDILSLSLLELTSSNYFNKDTANDILKDIFNYDGNLKMEAKRLRYHKIQFNEKIKLNLKPIKQLYSMEYFIKCQDSNFTSSICFINKTTMIIKDDSHLLTEPITIDNSTNLLNNPKIEFGVKYDKKENIKSIWYYPKPTNYDKNISISQENYIYYFKRLISYQEIKR